MGFEILILILIMFFLGLFLGAFIVQWFLNDLYPERIEELSKSHQPTVTSAVCVSCDEQKETYELCMDCVKKLIRENKQTDL